MSTLPATCVGSVNELTLGVTLQYVMQSVVERRRTLSGTV